MKNIFKVTFVILGTILGAGFASGQEIGLFFNRYEEKGYIGLIFMSLVLMVSIYLTFEFIVKKNIKTYKEFTENLINKKASKGLDVIVNMFLLITFYIMIAGVGTYFDQELNLQFIIGSIIAASVCFIVYMFNLKGILTINSIIVPILVIGILYMSAQNFKDVNIYPGIYKNDVFFTNNSLVSAILYASYNSIILIPVLISLRDYTAKKKDALKISILSALIIFILGQIIFNILNLFYPQILTYDLPMVYLAGVLGKSAKCFYGIVILLAIFTSAISIGFSLLDNMSKTKRQYFIFSVALCVSSIFVSKLGFSNLVSILYPIFGYIGLIQLYFLFKKCN